MELLTIIRGSGAPPARLDHARFTTFGNLDIGELLAFVVMATVGPVILLGVRLPEPAHLITAALPVLWAILLFMLRFDDLPLVGWVGRMVPYWTRQRRFSAARPAGRVSPASERADLAVSSGENAISWRLLTGSDGGPELHLYESPVRPYRAIVAAGGVGRTPGVRTRWRR